VKQIARMASDPGDNRPLKPVKINHISIVKAGGTPAATAKKPTSGVKASTAPTTPPK